MKKLASTLFIAFVGGISAFGISYLVNRNQVSDHTHLSYSPPVHFAKMSTSNAENAVDFTLAAEMSVHAVVNVKTSYSVKNNAYYYDPFGGFFGNTVPQQEVEKSANGSGVIISADGYIVTNNHVVGDAEKIEVTLNDKRSYVAELIGRDPTTDLALPKIKESNLSYITYGNSDVVKIGEWVLAVGNPFNLTSTVTAGIVSAKARNINILENNPSKGLNPIESFIQTDAAVNPGNSGGALVNTKGELIGINSAIASNTGSYTGYSFAIPVNIVRKVVADLLEFGEVQRAFIGVNILDLDAKLAKEKNINELKGVFVQGLTMGGSGEEAGIKAGDVITKIEDADVNNVAELQEQISRYRPGDKINITLKRDNKNQVLKIVLKNKNGDVGIIKKAAAESVTSLGALFENINDTEKRKLHIDHGIKIKKLHAGKLLSAGIQEGFIITSIDKKKIESVADVTAVLENKHGGILIEGIYPNGIKAYYGFGL